MCYRVRTESGKLKKSLEIQTIPEKSEKSLEIQTFPGKSEKSLKNWEMAEKSMNFLGLTSCKKNPPLISARAVLQR